MDGWMDGWMDNDPKLRKNEIQLYNRKINKQTFKCQTDWVN
jgi:hypothetical protein